MLREKALFHQMICLHCFVEHFSHIIALCVINATQNIFLHFMFIFLCFMHIATVIMYLALSASKTSVTYTQYCSTLSSWMPLVMTHTEPQCCCCSADLLLMLQLVCRHGVNVQYVLLVLRNICVSLCQLTPFLLKFQFYFPGLYPDGIYKNICGIICLFFSLNFIIFFHCNII